MLEPLEQRHKHRLDWSGALTLLAWTSLLVFALETGGRDYGWGSPVIIGAFGHQHAPARHVHHDRTTCRRAAHPARPVQGPRPARGERDQPGHGHGDVRRVVVHAAVRAGGARRVGHRRRQRAHADDARHDRRLPDRWPHGDARRLPGAHLSGLIAAARRRAAALHARRRLHPARHHPPDGRSSASAWASSFISTTLAAQNSVGDQPHGRSPPASSTSPASSAARSAWPSPRR